LWRRAGRLTAIAMVVAVGYLVSLARAFAQTMQKAKIVWLAVVTTLPSLRL